MPGNPHQMLRIKQSFRLLALCLLAPLSAGSLAGEPQDRQAASQPPGPTTPTDAPAASPQTSLPAARDIINLCVEAMGGEQALANLKTTTAHCVIDSPQMMQAAIEMHWMKPNRVFIRQGLQGMDSTMGFDGTVAWMKTPLGPQILSEDVASELSQQANMFGMILHFRDGMKEIKTLERFTFNGTECFRLELIPDSGAVMYAYFDVADHLIRGVQRGASGSPQMTISRFSEWQETSGILHFTRIDIEQQGQSVPLILQKVQFNSTDEALFVVPDDIKALHRAQQEAPEVPQAQPSRDEG